MGLKNIIQWIFAGVISLIFCNTICFFYEAPAGWIDRNNAATSAIWNPGSFLVHGTEGYGVYKADHRGYLNPEKSLGGGYSVVVGSSFTQGKEVMPGYRYVDLLNRKTNDSSSIMFYTVSKDGFYLPQIIKRFKAITTEFPDASNIILEIDRTTFKDEEWEDCLNQIDFDEEETGDHIVDSLSVKKRLVILAKERIPLLSVLKKQMEIMSQTDNLEQNTDSSKAYTQDQLDIILAAMRLLKQQFSGNIYILYHPHVNIRPDGSLDILTEMATHQFKNICEANGIAFIDTTDAFLDAYNKDFLVPYGFNNTSIGTGHFNKDGHKIVAEEVYIALKGDGR